MDFGFLCGFWVSVWILGPCGDFGSLCEFWVPAEILGLCEDFGSLFGSWARVCAWKCALGSVDF